MFGKCEFWKQRKLRERSSCSGRGWGVRLDVNNLVVSTTLLVSTPESTRIYGLCRLRPHPLQQARGLSGGCGGVAHHLRREGFVDFALPGKYE